MAAMSLLRTVVQANVNRFRMVTVPNQMQSIRSVHARTLEIHPSTYGWYEFKDMFHFYFLLGFIPYALFATYQNLRYGRAVLSDLPENYEPHLYETERHPVTRFIVWMTDNHPRYEHERKLDMMNHEAEKVMLRRIEKQVRAVMKVRGDHKSWYYQPGWQAKYDRGRRRVTERNVERHGMVDSHYILGGELKDATDPYEPASRQPTSESRAGGPRYAMDDE